MVVTQEQAGELKLKDELAPLRRLKEAKHNRMDLAFERERLFNEELTDIAEAIDNHYLESNFTYGFDGRNVILPDGTRLIDMYERGVESARLMANRHKEFGFEWMRRQAEADNQALIDAMMRGEIEANTVIELSAYPEEAEAAFGKDGKRLMEDNGYKPDLRRGMVRIARKTDEGQLSLTTFSLDNSNTESFRHIQAILGQKPDKTTQGILANPKFLTTDLTPEQLLNRISEAYDLRQEQITGRKSRRGRFDDNGNSMRMLEDSKPVLDFYFNQLEVLSDDWVEETLSPALTKTISSILARQDQAAAQLPLEFANELHSALSNRRLNETSVSIIKRALELSVWATVVNQLEQPGRQNTAVSFNQMLDNAYKAEAAGQRMVGCGGATSLFTGGRASAMEQIFGGFMKLEARYSFNRRMHCVVCQKPPRKDPKTKKTEGQKWCGPCGICRGCDQKLKNRRK